MTVILRRCSLWTAMVGFGFFVAGQYEAAFVVRLVTEALRLPYFIEAGIRDQVALSVFVSLGCLFGVARLVVS